MHFKYDIFAFCPSIRLTFLQSPPTLNFMSKTCSPFVWHCGKLGLLKTPADFILYIMGKAGTDKVGKDGEKNARQIVRFRN